MATTSAETTRSHNPSSRLQAPLLWLLVMAMMTAPIVLLQQQSGGGAWTDAYPLFGLTVAWSLFATTYLARLPGWERQAGRYRSAELIAIAVLLRLYLWLLNGWPTVADWREILRDPFMLFSGLWPVYFVAVVAVWFWTNGLALLFHQLEVTPQEESFYSLPIKERQSKLDTPLRLQRTPLLEAFFRRWVIGGLFLIVCASATTVQIEGISDVQWFTQLNRLPMPGSVLLGLIVYFFVGFWLLSYARYTVLYARWMVHGARPQAAMARHWRRNSFLLLAVIGLAAALLPIGSTMPLAWLINLLVWLITTLAFALYGLFVRLFRRESSGENGLTQEPFEQLQEQAFQPPAPLVDPGATNTIPPEITGLFILAVIVTVAVIAIGFLVYGRSYGNAGESVGDLWQRFVTWWRSLWGSARLRVLEIRAQVQQLADAEVAASDKPIRQRFFRINALSPREQVRYFYLSTVKRAADRGVERGAGQTPVEFLENLQEEWPDSAESTQDLTDAFLHARYSRQDVGDAGSTKQTWKRVRSSLRKRRKNTRESL